ncbi:dynamin family protein [Endozoicomonas sp. 4G]|uniref:dynamin family protein n=1 Tax=Endozoicomonas sp. 4G TaxID=2872754 RepID=UPI002078782A|nr:dynamin family protein [Endozoicomonas sp. 4G]
MPPINDELDPQQIIHFSQKKAISILDQLESYAETMSWSDQHQKEFLSTINRERSNLGSLDLKMAVVGVMKAGKSTLINSLVGQELLPNRSTAMTLLPTYIRHSASESAGTYYFKHADWFNQFIQDYQEEFEQYRHKMNPEKGFGPLNACESVSGLDAIQQQLLLINDFARFACEEGRNPDILNCLQGDEDFPEVNIAMACLENQTGINQVGQLVLVDNPGANEAGITKHLNNLVHKQLERAGVLLCTLDYTALNNVSDQELRTAVQSYAEAYKDRIIVAVNKFDQEDCNSMDAKATRSYVQDKLLKGLDLGQDRVYPLSARHAYLALKAQKSLSNKQSWRISEQEGWQGDFLKASMATLYDPEKGLEEPYLGMLPKFAGNLLSASKQPLLVKGAIERAYANAGPDAIISSLAKVKVQLIDGRLLMTLQNKRQDIDTTVYELRAKIDHLSSLLGELVSFRDSLNEVLDGWPENQMRNVKQWVKAETEKFDWKVQTQNDQKPSSFRQRSSKQQAEEQAKGAGLELLKLPQADINSFEKLRNYLTGRQKEFSSKREAKEARRDLFKLVQADINSLNEKLRNYLTDRRKDLESDIQRRMSEFEVRFGQKLEKVAHVRVNPATFSLNIDSESLGADSQVQKDTKRYSVKKPPKLFGFSLNFLPDLFYHTEIRTETSYTVNMKKIQEEVAQNIELQLTDNISGLSESLKKYVDEFTRNLEGTCRILEADSEQNLKNHELSKDEQEQLKQQVSSQQSEVEHISSETDELCEGLKLLRVKAA